MEVGQQLAHFPQQGPLPQARAQLRAVVPLVPRTINSKPEQLRRQPQQQRHPLQLPLQVVSTSGLKTPPAAGTMQLCSWILLRLAVSSAMPVVRSMSVSSHHLRPVPVLARLQLQLPLLAYARKDFGVSSGEGVKLGYMRCPVEIVNTRSTKNGFGAYDWSYTIFLRRLSWYI